MGNCKSGGSIATDSKPVTNRDAGREELSETAALTSSSLDPTEKYKMDHRRRGLALIFNQENFLESLHLKRRTGTKFDRDNLEKRLKGLNFDVKIYNDYKRSDVEKKIREAANADHSNADCFVLVFLSHGKDNYVCAYDGEISIKDITSQFRGDKCRSLIGKPKIFILQACRGNIPEIPVTPEDGESGIEEEDCAIYTLPAGADFIMCYSVAEGFVSFRDPTKGTWYIQDLCEALQMYGTSLEFTDLLILVNRMVSQKESGGKKQMPCFASMLTKQLTFKPKK